MGDRPLNFWDEDEWHEIVDGWPEAVQKRFATRLRVVQKGGQPPSGAKPLSGFDIKVWELWHRDGQRVVYSVHYAAISGRVDVIDAFEKDSREGRAMRKGDKERIERRISALKSEMEESERKRRAIRRTTH